MALCLGWACWGEARYPLPYPAYAYEHQRDGSPLGNILPHLSTFGGRIWSMTGSPCHTLAAMRQCIMAIISVSCQNARTTSVFESWSTPSGCSWPNLTHDLTTSFSLNELGPNGLPLPWVVTSTHIWFLMSMSLPSVGIISSEAVAVDEADILVREENRPYQLMPGKEREGGLLCEAEMDP